MDTVRLVPASSVSVPHHASIDSLLPPIRAFFEKNRIASDLFCAEEPLRTSWITSHQFMVQEKICIDERCLDAHIAKGLLVGLTEFFRSAGGMCDIGTYAHARRVLDSVRKARDITVNGKAHPMAVLRFNTAHFSRSMPRTASCAAWKHQTNAALRFMQSSADELNGSFEKNLQLVAVPLKLDTDHDANEFIGPEGSVSVNDLIDDPHMMNGSSRQYVIDLLRKSFPPTWAPLQRLDAVYRDAFHLEMAERVLANVDFVRKVIDDKRPIELLVHQGRYIFFGRHADWITEHNSVFLIDDTDTKEHGLNGFSIALQHVAKNVILDAVACGDRDWIVPVIINIPHDDDDVLMTMNYTRKKRRMLEQKLESCAANTVEWLKEQIGTRMSKWVRLNAKSFIERVVFTTSVSHRRTRLFVPFV